jgi:hypothetical protein
MGFVDAGHPTHRHQTSTADLRAAETRIVQGRQVRDIETIINSDL